MEEKRKIKLFYKFLQKQLTKSEYEEFVAEFGKKDAHKNFDHLFDAYADNLIKEGQPLQFEKELLEEAEHVLKKAKQQERFAIHKKSNILHSSWLRVAAVILVVISVTLYWNSVNNQKKAAEVLSAEIINTLEKSTGYGELSNVVLSDGSNVKLNAKSKICFNEKFQGSTRELSLNGQAFFDVARDENKPFIIKSGQLTVTVLGTSFDVKSFDDDDYALVTVLSGKVKVNSPAGEYIITPNEQVYLEKSTGKLIKREVNAENIIKWTNRILYFDHTPVTEMISQLERWYNVKIIVNDPELLLKTVSGEYVNEKLTTILQTLEFSLHIQFEITNEREITLSKSI